MKKFIIGLLVGLIMATSAGLYAEAVVGGIGVYVDEEQVYTDTLRWDGKVYIPLRDVLEATGCLVGWNEEGQYVMVLTPDHWTKELPSEVPPYTPPNYTPPVYEQPIHEEPDHTAEYQRELAILESAHQSKLAELDSRQASAQAEYDANKNLPSTVITAAPDFCPLCSRSLMVAKSYSLNGTRTSVLNCNNPQCPNQGREVARSQYSVPAEAALQKYDSQMAQISAERQSAYSAYDSVKQQLKDQYSIY